MRDQVLGSVAASGGTVPVDGLYVLWGGSNDARDAIDAVIMTGDPAAALPFINGYKSALDASVTALASAGATTIMLPNVGDLGLTPAALIADSAAPGSAARATEMALAFNAAWSMALLELAASLGPTVDLIPLDVFTLLRNVATNPGLFGLTDVTNACGFDPLCIPMPDGHFFWDGIHPTAAGHAIIADFALLALVPAPGTLILLASGLLLVHLCRRGRMGASPGVRSARTLAA